MTKRKTISKKIRFEVFKRDAFSCQYCGQSPPSVILELDHIQPVSKKGSDEIDNLLTACFDCNRGKSDRLLQVLPSTIKAKSGILKEKEMQLKEYKKLLSLIKARQTRDVNKVLSIFYDYFDDIILTEDAKNSIRFRFLSCMIVADVEKAMHLACLKCKEPERTFKYFCGICWKCIKNKESP